MAVDPTYQTKNYEKEGGDTWVVGGTLEIDGTLQFGGVAQSGVVRAGQHTVTSGEASATTLGITTGLTTSVAQTVQIIRAGKVATSDAAVSFATGTLTVANGSSFTLTAGDVINYVVVGS